MITVWHNASFPNAIKTSLPRWMQLLEKRRGEEDRPTINYTGSVAKKRKEKRKERGKKERERERKGRENFTREEKEAENIGGDLYFDTILER